ncbi:MAG: hypothetical protein SNF33_02395 [Candidatus Algichlamydia australiensis]|nr:hypothetical protein [Chlamydiales bacterium]
MEEAIEHFIDNKYRSFDALIGNNSCYIVSYHIFFLAEKMQRNKEFQDLIFSEYLRIKKLKSKVKQSLKSVNLKFPLTIQFKEFLILNELELYLNADTLFLTMCFGCTISKSMNSDNFEEIDYKKLFLKYDVKNGCSLSKKSTIKLIKHWQRIISLENVRRLQFQAEFISDDLQDWQGYIKDEFVVKDSHSRLCLPSLFSLKVIYCLLTNIPGALIGLQVNLISKSNNYLSRFTVYYEVQEDKTIKSIKQELIKSTKPTYLFSGCRSVDNPEVFQCNALRKYFSNKNLSEIIFAHEVTYPQYPKSLKVENIKYVEDKVCREISRLKKMKGYSIDDPHEFCTVHVFVDDTDTQALSIYEPPIYLPSLICEKGKQEPKN